MIIVCATDNNYIRHCAVMLRSLYEINATEELCVYIIHGELDEIEKNKLASYLDEFLSQVKFIQVDPLLLNGFPTSAHLSISAYFRFLIPSILPPEIDRAIYLDCDLIVVDSLAKLWNMPLADHSLALVMDNHIKANCRRLGIPETWGYFNSGVALINLDRWRRKGIISEGLEFVKNTNANLKYCDQDVLNAISGGQWLRLDLRWNALPHLWGLFAVPEEEEEEYRAQNIAARDNPAVVHFAGGGSLKPWNYYCKHPFRNRYLELRKKTPWAEVHLDSLPPPIPVRLWRRIIFELQRLGRN